MIERFTLTTPEALVPAFGAVLPAGVTPRYNIAPLQRSVVLVGGELRRMRWGLLPRWKGHGGKREPHILTVSAGELAATALLREASERGRGLALADGWFAWRKLGKSRQPYWIHREPPAVFGFAVVTATSKDDREPAFAIVTGPANALVAPIGPTMPRVGDDRWLASGELVPEAATGWRADAVATYVNAEDHDDPKCVEPLGNPAQGELF